MLWFSWIVLKIFFVTEPRGQTFTDPYEKFNTAARVSSCLASSGSGIFPACGGSGPVRCCHLPGWWTKSFVESRRPCRGHVWRCNVPGCPSHRLHGPSRDGLSAAASRVSFKELEDRPIYSLIFVFFYVYYLLCVQSCIEHKELYIISTIAVLNLF